MTTTYRIRNQPFLRQVLWADAIADGLTALIGLFFFTVLNQLLGLPTNLIIVIAVVTLSYGVLAFRLALQRTTSVPLLRALVTANWVWTGVSVVLLFVHGSRATPLGLAFLILQLLVVGGLAYVEGNQLVKVKSSEGHAVS